MNEIKPVSTHTVIDSTKLSSYQECPRRYFYEYILGWRSDQESQDLVFGSAYHKLMEHLLNNGYSMESIYAGYQKLENYYREKFIEETDFTYFPKVPGVVLLHIPRYCVENAADFTTHRILYTEVAGTVSVGSNRILYFKMDSIRENLSTSKVSSLEHKTGKRDSRQWRDQWKMKGQVGTYDHVMRCLFGPDNVEGVIINGAIFTKGKSGTGEVKFQRIPVLKKPEMSEAWLWNVNEWLNDIENDMNRLTSCSDSRPIMQAFRQNTESCTDYYGCQYMDFCTNWANPLQHIHTVPIGFKEDHWDPRTVEATTRITI
jgi:hypothetical protein